MLKKFLCALAALTLSVVSASAQSAVPAERFVDPVSAWGASISPDGNYIAYIARNDTDERVVVVDLRAQQAHAIQSISRANANIESLSWKGDRLFMVASFRQMIAGRAATGTTIRSDDRYYWIGRVIAMNRDGSNLVQMFEGQTGQLVYGYGSTVVLDELPADPDHILIAAEDLNGTGIYRANVRDGSTERIEDGEDLTYRYTTDINGAVVMRKDELNDGSGYRIYRRAPGAHDWTLVTEARLAATATNSPDFQIIASGPAAGQVYVVARRDNADFLSLYLYDTATGDFGQPLSTAETGDFPWLTRGTRQVLALCGGGVRMTCHASDPAVQRNLNALDTFFQHQATIDLVNMSDDGGKWLVHVDGPTFSGAYYLYELASHRVSPVAAVYPNLDDNALSPTQVIDYQSRDGTALWAYVTARPGVAGARPMVVYPHGGPELRDEFGYDPFVQFLASRGYVVLQPNFRGGSGFGRAFADAGRGQWGLRMQDDVTDAVRHMIDTGIVDPHRICIVGGSYGGYAALEGVSSTPDLYRCAVSIAGVSDLQLSLDREGPHWGSNYQYWLRSIGTDSAAIAEHSPRLHAARITAPVLLIHGVDDTTVPYRQSELMQQALNAAGHPTRLVRVPDETHYWDTWSDEHRVTVFREMDQFLAQNLRPAH